MTFAVKQTILTLTQCGGLRRSISRGTGVVSGTTSIAGVASPCRVELRDGDDTRVAFMRSSASGVYSFIGLAPGEYSIVIRDDKQTAHRAKVEHVVVG